MDSTIEVYKLTSFASLFEVAVAINLVFSTWSALRNKALLTFKDKASQFKVELKARIGDKYEGSRCSIKFEEKIMNYKVFLEKLSTVGNWTGLSVSLFLISLLLYLGFNPEFSLGFISTLSITLLSVLPTGIFLVLGKIYVDYSSKKIQEYIDQQTTAMDDLADAYDIAIVPS
jgi:uncharacterized membrane protein SpoIIM required for sporulation